MLTTPSATELLERFPVLHKPLRWEWAGVDATFSTVAPADGLVTNVHVVGFVGDEVVVCRDQHDVWFLPGGTREPGESVNECSRRELVEEAGARLTSPLHWLGAHHAVSDQPRPYRSHQPHPRRAWLWCAADVVVDGVPTNPADGEQVQEVRTTSIREVQDLLSPYGDWYPELLALAVLLRR